MCLLDVRPPNIAINNWLIKNTLTDWLT